MSTSRPNPTLYYVRHGQTDWNAEFRFQGQRDIPLNAKGQSQADENGRKLRELLGEAPALPFVASPLGRARETMERIRRKLGMPEDGYEIEHRLIESSYGDWEGVRLEDIKANQNKAHRARKADKWGFQPPNGESHAMVAERVRPVIEAIEEDTVIVAHGMVGRVVRQIMLDLDLDEAGELVFPQDKICVLRRNEEEFV